MNLNKPAQDDRALINEIVEARDELNRKIDQLLQKVGGDLPVEEMMFKENGFIYFFDNASKYRQAKPLAHVQRTLLSAWTYSTKTQTFVKHSTRSNIESKMVRFFEGQGYEICVTAGNLFVLDNGSIVCEYNYGLRKFVGNISEDLVAQFVVHEIKAEIE